MLFYLCFSGEKNECDCLGLHFGVCVCMYLLSTQSNQIHLVEGLTHDHRLIKLRFLFTIVNDDSQDFLIEQNCTIPKRPRGLVNVREQKGTTEAIRQYPLTLGPRLDN